MVLFFLVLKQSRFLLGCPIFSRNHIKKPVTGSGRLQITTKNGISPKLNGSVDFSFFRRILFREFRVHCLNPLTIDQLGEKSPTGREDQGADIVAEQQQKGDGRILRRIRARMNSVFEVLFIFLLTNKQEF